MRSCTIVRDGARLNGVDRGQGPAVVFQHGLGGDEAQVAEVFPDGAFRRLTLECRAQGGSDAGDPANFSLATFADDILAFADARGLERFVVGGVSMGAALSLRIAIKTPDRVGGLILARPAWAWGAAPANLQPIATLASYVARGAREDFERSDVALDLARHAPDNLSSLLASFDRPDRAIRSRLLAAIAADGPGVSEDDARRIRVPTLVLGNTDRSPSSARAGPPARRRDSRRALCRDRAQVSRQGASCRGVPRGRRGVLEAGDPNVVTRALRIASPCPAALPTAQPLAASASRDSRSSAGPLVGMSV